MVLNPSFEDYYSCPTNFGQVDSCKFVFNPNSDVGSTPDYFHSCSQNVYYQVPSNQFGYKQAKNGNAYVGFYLGLEYIQIKLSKKLESNTFYDFSFNLSLPTNSESASSDIQIKFANDSIKYNQIPPMLNIIPDWTNNQGFINDTIGWTKLKARYNANGGENWILIGCFKPINSIVLELFSVTGGLPYYFIDDFNLEEFQINLPNIFTPNGDGINDDFYIDGLNADDDIFIYNRWGDTIKKMKGNDKWNGDFCNDGVYFIIINSGKTKVKSGFIQLIR